MTQDGNKTVAAKLKPLRKCEVCGSVTTLRGRTLTGPYCSPACRVKAQSFYDSHGAREIGRGARPMNEGEYNESKGKTFNPLAGLLDRRYDE